MPLEWAAIPLRSLMRKIRGVYRPLAKSPAELRTRFGLHATTKIILLGIGKDPPIETYWRWRRFHAAPDALAQLDLYCAIAPNYSLFLNEPRTQHLFNRKRSLICASEFSGAGIPPIPYLHTITPADWKFWETFLKEHGEVDSIAEEFQTGLARPERGLDAIASLARLQDSLRRPLHLMAVGGASYGSLISAHFDRFTIIDSVPFMKAVKRRRATPGVRGIKWAQALGEDVGDLAFHNSRRYAEWIASMIKTSSQARPRHLGSARRDSPDSAKPV